MVKIRVMELAGVREDAGLNFIYASAKKEEQIHKYLYLLPIMCYTICSFIDLINDGGE